MFCSTLFRRLFQKEKRKYSYDDDQSEEVELKKNHEDEYESAFAREEEKYFWKRYTSKGIRKMSPLAVLCWDEISPENTEFHKLLQCLHQGNNCAFAEKLNVLTKDELNTLAFAGQHILHLICFRKDIDALRIILDLEVKMDITNADGITPLHVAVNEGWLEGVAELLARGASSSILPPKHKRGKFPWRELPIHTAARNGNFYIVTLLLERNPDLTFANSEGNTVLHLAALSHCSEVLSRLLEESVMVKNISIGNNNGNSPLHSLMHGENLLRDEKKVLDCAQLLLQSGANINHLNVTGKSPLFLAARTNLPLVVRALLNAGASPTVIVNDGRSALHAACKSDSHQSLSLLLASGKVASLVLQVDNKRLAPFHYAVSSCSIACCELLLNNGDHLTRVDFLGRSRCSLVLKNMPSGIQLLKKVFDSHVKLSDDPIDDPDFKIEMDFSTLLSTTSETVEASLIVDLNNSNGDSLLKHPLVESFLYLKWHKIKGFFYIYLILYFIFLLVHTFYIIKTYDMNTNWEKEKKMLEAIHWLHVSLLLGLLLPSAVTIFANFKKYVKQWETYFKVVALAFSAFVVFARESNFFTAEISRNIATCSIFFTWVEFMMLLGRFPSLGIYILMFTRVSKSVLKFLLAFSPLIMAFSLAFSILFADIETFKTYPTVFVRTLMMMIGEIDYSTIHSDIKNLGKISMIMSQVFLVVFVVLIPILMANLLIGLAVSDLPDLQLHGKIRRLVKEASYLESYERLMLFFKDILRFPLIFTGTLSGRGSVKRIISIYPNQRNHRDSVSIPPEAIDAAMASGTRTNAEEDLKTSFKKFRKTYADDRLSLEKALQVIYDAIQERSVGQEQVDVVDSRCLGPRKISMYDIKNKKLFADSVDMSY